MNYPRVIAGISAGAGALLLIYLGHVSEGAIILSTMLAFFVGEENAKRSK